MNKKDLPFSSKKKGMTLLPLIFVIMIMTGLIAAGIAVVAPLTKKAKYNDTQAAIDAAMKAVIGWSVANNRIPDASTGATGFATVAGNSNDAWNRSLVYIAADNLLNPSPAAICSRATTNLRVSPVPGDIAFVVISGGDDYTVNTTPNTSQAYNGTVAVSQNDVVRWVTLDELKSRAGCYGLTPGRLRILNNELPGACIGQSYSATLYSDGGVAPYSSWTFSAMPAGLSMNAGTGAISGTPAGPAQVHSITFSRSDGDGNTAQRMLKLIVEDCALGSWNFDDPANPGGTIATGAGGSVASVAGVSGSALSFVGVGSLTPYNQGIGNPVFSFEYNQPFSIIMWVKLTKLPTTAPASLVYPLVSKGGAAPDYSGYYFEIHSSANSQPAVGYNRLVFQLTNQYNAGAGPMVWVYNTTPLNTVNAWYHVAATYNGNGLASGAKVYVSGGSANASYRDNLASSSIVNTQPLRFGDYGQNYYNSVVMDGIQIYSKVVQQLRVVKAGTGSGTVASSLFFRSTEKINCGSICEAYYPNGTIVALAASASAGSTFAGWSGGGCSGTGTCLVTIAGDTNVTATFTTP
jgi:type II secretory pathway pseudopilin PulG